MEDIWEICFFFLKKTILIGFLTWIIAQLGNTHTWLGEDYQKHTSVLISLPLCQSSTTTSAFHLCSIKLIEVHFSAVFRYGECEWKFIKGVVIDANNFPQIKILSGNSTKPFLGTQEIALPSSSGVWTGFVSISYTCYGKKLSVICVLPRKLPSQFL